MEQAYRLETTNRKTIDLSLGKEHLAGYIAVPDFQFFCPIRILTSSINPNSLTVFKQALATILQSKFGICEFVHYALRCENGQVNNLEKQQQELAEKIIDSVKVSLGSQSSVFLAGPSLAYVAERLSDLGHSVDWLNSPTKAGSDKTEKQILRFEHTFITDYPESDEFDAVVLEGSYHYLQQIGWLQKCKELIVDGGSLIILGEFLDDDSQRKYSALPNLSSLKQLCDRLGFELLSEIGLTADAIASIDAFKNILQEEKGIFSEQEETTILSMLDEAWSEFNTKRRCYKLFRFIKVVKDAGDYTSAHYGSIESFDSREICQLFEKSFDTSFDHQVWRWKYELGNGKCVVARSEPGGAIVSHYGGAPRQIHYFGELNTAIQVCDVMVLPEVRLRYGKSSLFFKTAATFLEREIGNTVGHLLGFGFPNKKAMNIALRLGLYEKTDDFVELILPSANNISSSEYKLLDIDSENPNHWDAVNRLWKSMYPDFETGIIGIRDWAYIKYRYFDHPFGNSGQFKRLFLFNPQGDICAAFFLKEHDQCNLIMDIIAPLKDITKYVLQLNILLNETELKLWITKGWSEAIDIVGLVENDLGIEIPCNHWNPGPSSKLLFGAWWLTAGDMDFM